MGTDTRSQTGRLGEDAAAAAYERLGYRIVERNWRCRIGELDLILEMEWMLVFCEVKTRRSTSFGDGFVSVDERKQQKLRAVAHTYVMQTGAQPCGVRFDVASVLLRPNGTTRVDLFMDAFY
jgi:putative endonuclease